MTTPRKEVIGPVTLYLGDCREILPPLPDFSAVITDPPYGLGERSGTVSKERNRNPYLSYDDTRESIISNIVPAFKLALSKAKRAVITPGGRCAFLYPEPVAIGSLFQPATSSLCHWGKATSQPVLFYGKDPLSGIKILPIHYMNNEAPEKSIHPCPKPLGVMHWMVGRGSLPGEIVCDPFAGSGTTGVACVNMGRECILIEREPEYFEVVCRRIRMAVAQGDLFRGENL